MLCDNYTRILSSFIILVFSWLTFQADAVNNVEKANQTTLKLVQVLFRHGDRAPTYSYPNDPYANDSTIWPEGMAQLTSMGKMQQYHLGQYLRGRYDGFIGPKYISEEMYGVSSDMDRTIMSLQSNFAGLFPPVNRWNPLLDWQPIPLRTIPWAEDLYLHMNVKCKKYERLYWDFMNNSPVVQSLNEKNRNFVRFLSKKSGIPAKTVKEILHLQDILLVQWTHNLTLPKWAEQALPRLNALQAEVNSWSTYTPEMKRLKGGPLVHLLLKNMMAKSGHLRVSTVDEKRGVVGGGKNRKMLMYSAHDSTLSRLMNTLGIFYPHNPPYAAALIFELHSQGFTFQDYFIKILYRNETDGEPHEMKVAECASPCSLTRFIELTEHLIPKDLTRECHEGFLSISPTISNTILQEIGLVLLMMLIIGFFWFVGRNLDAWRKSEGRFLVEKSAKNLYETI